MILCETIRLYLRPLTDIPSLEAPESVDSLESKEIILIDGAFQLLNHVRSNVQLIMDRLLELDTKVNTLLSCALDENWNPERNVSTSIALAIRYFCYSYDI
jgi:hypothetical protein